MRITVFMGPWFPVPTVQGGSHHRLWQGLAEQFAAKGHDVTIICRGYEGQPRSETVSGVRYLRRGGFAQSTSTVVNLAKDLIYGLHQLPAVPAGDIIVVNDFWFPLLAALLRRRAGRVVIAAGRFPKGQFFLYRGAARFCAPSHAIRKGIEAQAPSAAHKIRVFPNPTNTRLFHPPETPRRLDGGSTLLYAGRVHPEKGLDVLLDAFALAAPRLPRLKLRIMGPVKQSQGGGGEEYLRVVRRKAEGLNVDFAEPTFDLRELAAAYRAADLFCYPSQAEQGEAFPVAPLEAMATGLVPLVSDLDCFRDLIDEGVNGLYFRRGPQAAHDLADRLVHAIAHPDVIREMSVKAVEKAQLFGYERVAEQYLADFEGLLEGVTSDPSAYLCRGAES